MLTLITLVTVTVGAYVSSMVNSVVTRVRSGPSPPPNSFTCPFLHARGGYEIVFVGAGEGQVRGPSGVTGVLRTLRPIRALRLPLLRSRQSLQMSRVARPVAPLVTLLPVITLCRTRLSPYSRSACMLARTVLDPCWQLCYYLSTHLFRVATTLAVV